MAEKSTVQVVGVGLPRTGTKSLQHALRILGYERCHHMITDVLEDGFPYRKGRRWLRVFAMTDKQQRQAEMKSIFEDGNFQASVDFPPSALPEDMLEIYPDAKFILGVRKSPELWRASFNDTVGLSLTPWYAFLTWPLPLSRIILQPLCRAWDRLNEARFGTRAFCNDSIDIYIRYNEWMRKVIPPDRLLEHEPADGWEPLCKFLDVKVPDTPYPRTNERVPLRRWFFQLAAIGGLSWILVIGLTIKAAHYLYTRTAGPI